MQHPGLHSAAQAADPLSAGDVAPLFAAINANVSRIADALTGVGERMARMETAHAAEIRRIDANQSRMAGLLDTASERLQSITVEVATLRERFRGADRSGQDSAGLRRQIDLRLWQIVTICASSAGAGGGLVAALKHLLQIGGGQ